MFLKYINQGNRIKIQAHYECRTMQWSPIDNKQKKDILKSYNMKQKITHMRLIRYLFTIVLALLFISCSKGCSYNESQPSHVEQTTFSNQVEDKISPDNYELSADGLTLIKWKNPNTKVLDMNRDTLLSKIRFIGDWAFWDCNGLTSINIPNSVTSIGEWAFMQCSSLTSINIPNSVTSIKHYAFSNCSSLTSIDIPNSVTSIEQGTFSDCNSLTNTYIPSSVTSIGKEAFASCSHLTDIHIPSSVTSIESQAFMQCLRLKSVNIPSSVTSIGKEVFAFCSSLTSINIPNSVRSIGRAAFYDCGSLTNVTIPISVTSIDKFAFARCINLGSVVFKGNNPPKIPSFDSYVFNETPSNLKLIIPKGAKNRYIKAGYPEDKIIEQ